MKKTKKENAIFDSFLKKMFSYFIKQFINHIIEFVEELQTCIENYHNREEEKGKRNITIQSLIDVLEAMKDKQETANPTKSQ